MRNVVTKLEKALRREMKAMDLEIMRTLATAYGYGNLEDLNKATRRQLAEELEGLIDAHSTAHMYALMREREIDDRFESEIGRLLQERREIGEQILDIEDERMARKHKGYDPDA